MKKLLASAKSIPRRTEITSMATVGKSDGDKPHFMVQVNPDAKRIGNPYLKYYDANNYLKADRVIRLGLTDLKAFDHSSERGIKFWKVNKEDLRVLDAFLSEKSKDFPAYTYWQMALYHWNNEYGFISNTDAYPTNIDAYMAGYYDTAENLNHKSYVPSTQEQQTYTNLI
jgi:hypothetical protein